jgi:hypothetical protein
MTGNDNSAGQSGIVATCGKPARAFREVAGVEAAKLPEPCYLDRTLVVCRDEGGRRDSGVRLIITPGKFA